MGRAATNGGAASVPTPFAQVLSVYPEDRVGDEAKAYFAFKRALDARSTLSAVLATSPADDGHYGAVPCLSEAMQAIERLHNDEGKL